MSDITLDVYLNGKKIGFAKSQSWYNSGRMFFVDERTDDELCKGCFPEDIENYGGFDKVSFKVRAEPKRKPLSDGVLPLTREELAQIKKMTGAVFALGVKIVYSHLEYVLPNGYFDTRCVESVKVIIWLAERFELTSNN